MQSHDYVYTVEEYWKMVEAFPEHRYEYIDGDIRLMTGGSPAHALIGGNVTTLLNVALREKDCNVYNSDVVVRLLADIHYCPDASVSCDPNDWRNPQYIESPTLVVEILSPNTEKKDTTEKLRNYKNYPSIQEILLIDSRICYVEQQHRVGVHKWEVSTFHSRDEVIELKSVAVSLLVVDIYRKVYLQAEEQL